MALVKLYWDWYLQGPKQEIIKKIILKKPFNFQTFDTRQIGMFVSNVSVPGQPHKIDDDIATFPPTVVYLTSSIKRKWIPVPILTGMTGRRDTRFTDFPSNRSTDAVRT